MELLEMIGLCGFLYIWLIPMGLMVSLDMWLNQPCIIQCRLGGVLKMLLRGV